MLTTHGIYHDYEESACTETQMLVSMIELTLVLTIMYCTRKYKAIVFHA